MEGFEWLYEQVDPGVLVNLGSGGTDVCTGIVQGYPLLPVYAGEMSGRCLGVDVAAFDPDGEPGRRRARRARDRAADAVDAGRALERPRRLARYRAAYFDAFPGVWRHGDWIMFTERGSSVITGRSDATLNRGGVRLGTSEFYVVVEELDEVLDSLVVHLERPGRAAPVRRAPRGASSSTTSCGPGSPGALRTALSPRHVPDDDRRRAGDPAHADRARSSSCRSSGSSTGAAPAEVVSADALVDPASIEPFVAYARTRSG